MAAKASKGGVECEDGEDAGPKGWIVRSHMDWRGEQNITYKGVKTSH